MEIERRKHVSKMKKVGEFLMQFCLMFRVGCCLNDWILSGLCNEIKNRPRKTNEKWLCSVQRLPIGRQYRLISFRQNSDQKVNINNLMSFVVVVVRCWLHLFAILSFPVLKFFYFVQTLNEINLTTSKPQEPTASEKKRTIHCGLRCYRLINVHKYH